MVAMVGAGGNGRTVGIVRTVGTVAGGPEAGRRAPVAAHLARASPLLRILSGSRSRR
jgi:hypothetical protein